MDRPPALQMKQKRNLPFSALLLIAFAAVGLHALLIFLFKPIQTDSHALRTGSHYTVICKPEDLAGKDIHQLNYWLKYMEPETFVKPNDEHGFSMVREMRYYDFLQPVKAAPELFRRASGTYGADRRSVSVRELADLNSSPQIPVAVPHVKKAETVSAQYPVWSDLKGNLIYGLLFKDEASLKILRKNEAETSTILSIVPAPEKDLPPEIRILRSSGNRTLDVLAERQLAIYAATAGLKKENLFLVTWNRPVIKKEAEK